MAEKLPRRQGFHTPPEANYFPGPSSRAGEWNKAECIRVRGYYLALQSALEKALKPAGEIADGVEFIEFSKDNYEAVKATLRRTVRVLRSYGLEI